MIGTAIMSPASDPAGNLSRLRFETPLAISGLNATVSALPAQTTMLVRGEPTIQGVLGHPIPVRETPLRTLLTNYVAVNFSVRAPQSQGFKAIVQDLRRRRQEAFHPSLRL